MIIAREIVVMNIIGEIIVLTNILYNCQIYWYYETLTLNWIVSTYLESNKNKDI